MLELGAGARAGGLEELIEIELVELTCAGDRQQLVRHLVRKEAQLGQPAIRVPLARVACRVVAARPLLIRVRPVEDLLFDELAGGKRPEGRTRKVQVRLGGYRQELGLARGEVDEIIVDLRQAA